MTSLTKAPPLYPKSHILAASGVAALLSLALLVFPSREVEAKKTYINLELDNGAEYAEQLDEPGSAATLPRLSPFASTAAQKAAKLAEVCFHPIYSGQLPLTIRQLPQDHD